MHFPRGDLAATLLKAPPLSAARLFACDELRCIDERFYATSWALFSFLLFQRFDQLHRYLQRLNELTHDQQAEAWAEAFPDLPPDRLDDELSKWLISGPIGFPRIEVAVHDVQTRERSLGDADVLAARSLLNLHRARRRPRDRRRPPRRLARLATGRTRGEGSRRSRGGAGPGVRAHRERRARMRAPSSAVVRLSWRLALRRSAQTTNVVADRAKPRGVR